MAEFVPRGQLIDVVKRIFLRRESCVVTIITESEHSVMIGFSEGRLTRLNSRGQDIAQAITLLRESQTLKFGVAESISEGEPDLMPVSDFLDLLEGHLTEVPRAPAIEPVTMAPAYSPPTVEAEISYAAPVAVQNPVHGTREINKILHDLAVEHIGPITDMVVDQAMSKSTRIEQIITEVANNIPDREAAAVFRREANARIRALINNQA